MTAGIFLNLCLSDNKFHIKRSTAGKVTVEMSNKNEEIELGLAKGNSMFPYL